MKPATTLVLGLCVVAAFVGAVNASGSNNNGPSLRVKKHPSQLVHLPKSSAALNVASYRQHLGRSAGTRPVLPMGGGVLSQGYYYAPVSVGTPAQTFNVLIDTGSSNLGIAATGCTTCSNSAKYDQTASTSAVDVPCSSAQCNTCNVPDPDFAAQSTSGCMYGAPFCSVERPSACGNGISYGGGSSFLSGHLVNEVVNFAGFAVNSTIVAIDRELPSGSFSSPPISGILGLAHDANACNPTCVPNLFTEIAASGQLQANLFSTCLTPSHGGVIDFGWIDETKFTGSLQYIPITHERWYNLPMQDVRFNGSSVGLPPFVYRYENDQIGTFIDSGTSVLLFAPQIMASIQQFWQEHFCALPGVCGAPGTTIFDGVCLNAAQSKNLPAFPDFELVFAGSEGEVSIKVPSSSYFMQQGDQSCFVVQAVPGIAAVLGDVVLENYYVVHDRANKRVGFGDITKCA